MKKVLLLFLLFMAAFTNVSSASSRQVRQNEGIIIIDIISGRLTVNPNDCLSAQSVHVKVLDASGNILGAAQTTPGQAVVFTYTGQERKAVCTYNFVNGYFIVIDVVIGG